MVIFHGKMLVHQRVSTSAQVAEGQMRIGRPRQLYVGPKQRTWIDAKARRSAWDLMVI